MSFQNSLFELLYDRDGSVGVQSSGGLIKKQHLGLYDQFHSDTGPLPLSTRYSTKKLIPNLHMDTVLIRQFLWQIRLYMALIVLMG